MTDAAPTFSNVLEAIGNTPQYVASYEVLLQLVLNPKTPRQTVTKLIRRLHLFKKMLKHLGLGGHLTINRGMANRKKDIKLHNISSAGTGLSSLS